MTMFEKSGEEVPPGGKMIGGEMWMMPKWEPKVDELVEMTVRCLVREINGSTAIVSIGHVEAYVPVGNLRQIREMQ